MQYNDFPSLYADADSASKTAQNYLLWFNRINNALLVLGAMLAFANLKSALYAVLCALVLLASLGIALYLKFNDLQAQWYRCRALSESIKTASWRFVMNADPFNTLEEHQSFDKFRRLLIELLQENRSIGKYLANDTNQRDEVTEAMLRVRMYDFQQKKKLYLEERIADQKKWYAAKSRSNSKHSTRWFVALCISYGCAIALSLLRIYKPDSEYFPIDVFIVIASSIIGWTQLKRFDELASAYNLTSHEIGVIKSQIDLVEDKDSLSKFVSDAENAFSREHIQWAARRDH